MELCAVATQAPVEMTFTLIPTSPLFPATRLTLIPIACAGVAFVIVHSTREPGSASTDATKFAPGATASGVAMVGFEIGHSPTL